MLGFQGGAGGGVLAFLQRLGRLISGFSGYRVGRWYAPSDGVAANNVLNPLANTLQLSEFSVYEDVTISDLAIRITTAQAASNLQVGVYASVNGQPSGAVLFNTASISGAAIVASISAAVTGGKLAGSGAYWVGVMCDSASVNIAAQVATNATHIRKVGAPAADAILANAPDTRYTTPCTFGTWPDLTGATLTAANGIASAFSFKVASVP